MLELRPTCEHCNTPLPPNSTEAMMCSFECTFCKHCVEHLLQNVCPNCGGGFVARPIRPKQNWKGDNFIGKYPPAAQPKHRPVNILDHDMFAAAIGKIPPEQR